MDKKFEFIEKVKSKWSVPDFLLALFCIVNILRDTVIDPAPMGNALTALVGGLIFLYVFIDKRSEKSIWKIVGLAVAFSVFMLLSYFYNQNADLPEVLWIWSFIGVAMLLFYYELDNQIIEMIFYLFSAYLMICMIAGVQIDMVLYYSGRNSISANLIFLMLIFYLLRGKKKKEIPYLPVTLSIVFCIWALGRAGVLTAAFFGILILGYDIVVLKNVRVRKIVVNVLIVFAGIFFLSEIKTTNVTPIPSLEKNETTSEIASGKTETQKVPGTVEKTETQKVPGTVEKTETQKVPGIVEKTETPVNEELTFAERIHSNGMQTARFDIWLEYFEYTVDSVGNFVLGVPSDKAGEWLSRYRQPHNSFLELHSKFGIVAFGIVLFALLRCFIGQIKQRKILEIIILLTLCLRSFLDWMAFPGAYDVIFWYFIFEGLHLNGKDVNTPIRQLAEEKK